MHPLPYCGGRNGAAAGGQAPLWPRPRPFPGDGGDGRQAAARVPAWNCSSSVLPFSATVDDLPPWMVWVMASK